MKYIGNYQSWINPLWEHLVLTRTGQARPRDWPPSSTVESQEYTKYKNAGYDLNAVNWYVYEETDLNISINPPWVKGKCHWWITKLNPGQYMPMHTDPDTHYNKCIRYWVPLQDYVVGHIFIYNNFMVSNYKAGDVYAYKDSIDEHGAANISYVPRLVLQVTEYDS